MADDDWHMNPFSLAPPFDYMRSLPARSTNIHQWIHSIEWLYSVIIIFISRDSNFILISTIICNGINVNLITYTGRTQFSRKRIMNKLALDSLLENSKGNNLIILLKRCAIQVNPEFFIEFQISFKIYREILHHRYWFSPVYLFFRRICAIYFQSFAL